MGFDMFRHESVRERIRERRAMEPEPYLGPPLTRFASCLVMAIRRFGND